MRRKVKDQWLLEVTGELTKASLSDKYDHHNGRVSVRMAIEALMGDHEPHKKGDVISCCLSLGLTEFAVNSTWNTLQDNREVVSVESIRWSANDDERDKPEERGMYVLKGARRFIHLENVDGRLVPCYRDGTEVKPEDLVPKPPDCRGGTSMTRYSRLDMIDEWVRPTVGTPGEVVERRLSYYLKK